LNKAAPRLLSVFTERAMFGVPTGSGTPSISCAPAQGGCSKGDLTTVSPDPPVRPVVATVLIVFV